VHETAIVNVLQKIMELINPPEPPEEPKPKRIKGFHPGPGYNDEC
jgi:hypothetical protein